jgi:hypothetical protein
VYRRLPSLLADEIIYSGSVSPTEREEEGAPSSQQAFISEIFVAAPPDLASCLQDELGVPAYTDLRAATRSPTSEEVDRIKGCLRTYGVPASVADTEGGMPVFFWLLTADDWKLILDALLLPDWLQTQAESLIDQLFEALRSDERYPVLSVPLADLKARLEGEEGYAALLQVMNAQPPCTTDQLARIATIASSTDPLKDIPICRPPEEMLDALAPNLQATLSFFADELPDSAEMKLVDETDPSSADRFTALRNAVGAVDLVSRLALLVPIVLLALVALCAARSVGGLLRWWGVPLVATGVISLGIAGAGLAVTNAVTGGVRGGSSGISPGLMQLAADAGRSLGQAFMLTLAFEALVVTLVGVGMVAASMAVRSRVVEPLPAGGLTPPWVASPPQPTPPWVASPPQPTPPWAAAEPPAAQPPVAEAQPTSPAGAEPPEPSTLGLDATPPFEPTPPAEPGAKE